MVPSFAASWRGKGAVSTPNPCRNSPKKTEKCPKFRRNCRRRLINKTLSNYRTAKGIIVQVIRSIAPQHISPVGLSVRVLLISHESPDNGLLHRLAGLGGKMEVALDLFVGLAAVLDDPAGYGLCVIDCDLFGGLAAGRRAHDLLVDVNRRVPVILISKEVSAQEFPEERGKPIVLRAPTSGISMRIGFEHALRDRLAMRLILADEQRIAS